MAHSNHPANSAARFRNWIKTNFIKDLNNAAAHLDYNEDESGTTQNMCGVTYGPLARSRRVVAPVVFTSTTPKWTRTENTEPYSADYYNFKLTTTDPKLKSLEITVDGAGALTTFVNMKAGESKKITDGTENKEIYTATFKPGELDTIGVIVGGGNAAGNYTISAVPCAHSIFQVSGTMSMGMCTILHLQQVRLGDRLDRADDADVLGAGGHGREYHGEDHRCEAQRPAAGRAACDRAVRRAHRPAR